ncbi:MAG: acyltransferase family protein [Cytophaga sp.]|uniref:acyltransferase family protein n=1 Tax=Cytophaga sp. TaxID=29535 RepID=UPI003F803C93
MLRISPGFFRFLLAFFVVLHHSVDFIVIGHTAVYIFFILSGYWIVKMYTEKYSKLKSPIANYLVSRVWRLFPVYFLVLIMGVLAAIVFKDLLHSKYLYDAGFFLSNIFVFNHSNTAYKLIGPAWSLDIELQFYVLIPLLIYINSKINNRLFLLISILITILYVTFIGYDYMCILNYLMYFSIGMYIYNTNWMAGKNLANMAVLAAVLIYALHFIIPDLREIFLRDKTFEIFGMKYREIINQVVCFLWIPFVSRNIKMKDYNINSDKLLSSMSYTIYLFHWPVLLCYVFYSSQYPQIKSIMWVGYLVACILGAYLISKYYDTFFEKKRRMYLDGKK